MGEQTSLSSDYVGLSDEEAHTRLIREGLNELPRAQRRTALRIVVEVMREPMLALLLGGAAVYLALGDLQEALIVLAFALVSISITVIQDLRTERVLEALRDLASPRALVIRDGVRKRIAGREVVRGDLMVLSEGDRVSADAMLLRAQSLQADESLLTGESIPVSKRARHGAEEPTSRPGGDELPQVYSGALIVRGTGIAVVTATGVRSELGRIGHALSTIQSEPPRLQTQTRRLVRMFALVGGAVSIVAVLLYGFLRGGWLEALLGGIALGMSMLPEEFPVVLTVFMAMGAWRISRARVLTRRAAAIEILGSATVLCTDKTGTLTQNRMAISELRLPEGRQAHITQGEVPPEFRAMIRFGTLASAQQPFDPMEKAFHVLARSACSRDGASTGANDERLLRAYGLTGKLLAVTQVWDESAEDDLTVASKGAPEAIIELCRLPPVEATRTKTAADGMAAQGLRVLGVARAHAPRGPLPDAPSEFRFEFLGLVGLADPLRDGVRAAVAECRTAGIRVVMITGDYPATALAIARQAGIEASATMTGDELVHQSDSELLQRVRNVTLFARIMPEQKLRVVRALKSNGEIVAMTGDGVNDAPSLKSADIGIAMGGRGTDVAREAASIVLLDDDFGSIVKAVRLGRRIYDNLRKAMAFIFAVHVPIAGLALLPLVFGLPIILGPIHIAFLEMVIDPVCTLVFESEREEDDVMRRAPRPPAKPLFSGALIVWGVLQGLVVLALVGGIYLLAYRRGLPENEVRALTFFCLVMGIVALIFLNRSFSASVIAAFRRRNRALGFVLVGIAAILGLTLWYRPAAELFRFARLPSGDVAVSFAIGLLVLVLLEFLKPHWHKRLAG